MRVRVTAYASAREALGSGRLELELETGSRVADLKRALLAAHPELEPIWPRLAIAVGSDLATEQTELREDAEVALLPPVSGGAPDRVLQRAALDPAAVLSRVSGPERGAALLFVGTARSRTAGRPVTHLTYDAYPPLAESRLRRIIEELEAAHEGLRLAIVHRLGQVPAGGISVVIAAAAPHRAAAYEASRAALERLKKEVPIWKREHFADGETTWRESEPLIV